VADNGSRVQDNCVTENKRRRWLINIVLIVALVGLLGTSLIPILDGISQQNVASPSPQASAANQLEELQAQVKGYEAVLQREPDNQTALRGLLYARIALVRQGAADVKSVIDPLERLVKLNPEQTEYSVLLAQAKEYNQDPEGAAQVYRNALVKKPGDQLALKGLVDLLLRQNRPEAAIGLLQETLKTAKQPTQSESGGIDVIGVQVELGRVYATQKRYEEAIAILDDAVKINKNDFRPVLGKALVLRDQGKPDEAKTLFSSAEALAPAEYKDEITRLASGSSPIAAPPTSAPVAPNSPGSTAVPTAPAPAPSSN
jgi:tetratricopeptide (TPR) repeat protein